jgi:hypothetical protein
VGVPGWDVDVHLVDLDAHHQAQVLLRVLHPLAATDNIYQAVNQYIILLRFIITYYRSSLISLHTATKIPFMYSFSGNFSASVPISTFMCL